MAATTIQMVHATGVVGQATLRGSVSFILREDGLHGCDRVIRILDEVCAEECKFLGLL